MRCLSSLLYHRSHFEDFSGSAGEQQEEQLEDVLRGRLIWANIVYAYKS